MTHPDELSVAIDKTRVAAFCALSSAAQCGPTTQRTCVGVLSSDCFPPCTLPRQEHEVPAPAAGVVRAMHHDDIVTRFARHVVVLSIDCVDMLHCCVVSEDGKEDANGDACEM